MDKVNICDCCTEKTIEVYNSRGSFICKRCLEWELQDNEITEDEYEEIIEEFDRRKEIYNSKLILEEFLEIQKNIKKLFQLGEYLIRTTKLIGCTIIVLLLLC